ncbi:hypothetical protein TrLO_g8560 [Triparma laevis f. longispina]|uniref:Uncharacterized protein n=1 Tax=Triparma laevis f. longispina TaxID=1714387 RepID=A0A9W7FK17_9STRA|nr:hypothetical protein TrLO_g8560 [Triparma laevis f. longispina]
MFVALAFINFAAGWIDNDLANAAMLVLSSLSLLSFIYQLYLWRETIISETANEDLAKKRQNSMFFFLFFYTVAYLSGVSACTKLLVAEATVEKVAGGILLHFYVFVPLWRLQGGAASAKAAVKETASEEGHRYTEKLYDFAEHKYNMVSKVIGGGEICTYKDSLGVFGKKAVESKTNEVTGQYKRGAQRLLRDSSGYKASVVAVLIAPFEEEYWF